MPEISKLRTNIAGSKKELSFDSTRVRIRIPIRNNPLGGIQIRYDPPDRNLIESGFESGYESFGSAILQNTKLICITHAVDN